MKTDVIIIGGGASGLMCAREAAGRGRSVLVIEHTERIGSKIRVAGGGRCNFTNRHVGPEHYLSRNPHFPTSALSRFAPNDFLALMERHRILYHEREAGRLFCDGSAQEIIDMLRTECDRVSVRYQLDCKILEIRKSTRFSVATNRGAFEAESLVVATGGLSWPNLGATHFGYALARQFGLKVTSLQPALAPLRFHEEEAKHFGTLSGISFLATVSFKGAAFQENILFTHTGLSGPAILQISSYWDRSSPIVIDLLPQVDILGILMEERQSKMRLTTLLDRYLPGRFVKAWCNLHVKSQPLNRYSPKELEALARSLHHWEIHPADTEGFNKAEVTLGGVDTRELSSKTMEARNVPGLYFIGEVLDVTGQLGGYNLHWAWASGQAAGRYV